MKYSACLVAPTLILCLLAAYPPPAAAGGGQTDNSAQIEKLRRQIRQLETQEARELRRKHAIQAELSTLEGKIARISRELQALTIRSRKLQVRQQALQAKSAREKVAAQHARQELAAALRAAFLLGREPQLKLALNGNDPATVARLLGYYGYFAKARAARLLELTATIKRYQLLQQNLQTTANDLRQTADARRTALARLEKIRLSRQAIMQRIAQDIANKRNRAEQLQRDAERLGKLIDSVNRDLADVPSKALDEVDFAQLRGRLPWPVNGRILNRFGAMRAESDLRWQAVRIAAPAGTDIRAIAYGRVAYAGWLPYYGLVLIVDHGSGYLTVYGHTQSVYKQVGDWVHAGEVLATVGASGGQSHPVLYFQIRHRGRALDPAHWCAKR